MVGTDTGVGKTVIAAGLIHALRARGVRVSAFKPLETGLCFPRAQTESANTPAYGAPTRTLQGEPADWLRLSISSGQPQASALGVAYSLPAAPLAAAQHGGAFPDWSRLERQLGELSDGSDWVVVEGAGGLAVPVDTGLLWADVLKSWRLPALVVARLGLGTINHTLLTVEALARREIPLLGVILNAVEDPGPESHFTPALIADFIDCAIFNPLPHGSTRPEQVAAHLESCRLVNHLLGDASVN